MTGEIVFIIKPNPDACSRCKEVGYKNGKDDSEGYKIHVAQANEFRAVHPVHPHCRCEVEVLDITFDSLKEKESIEEVLRDIKDKAEELSPDNMGGAKPPQYRKTELFYSGSSKQFVSYHQRVRRQPGSFFFTIISETVSDLIEFVTKFLRLRR